MEISEIRETMKISDKATLGVPGYCHDRATDTYQVWDGSQWIGNYRVTDSGQLEAVGIHQLLKETTA